jgi:hypothetical protein
MTCSAGCCASTGELHERIYAPYALRGRSHLPRTVGYVKTHQTAYLSGAQATVVSALRPAERTPVFLMGTSWRRHSWYLRLPSRSSAPWAGIVRCEASADLPTLAVRTLADVTALLLPPLAGVEYKDPAPRRTSCPSADWRSCSATGSATPACCTGLFGLPRCATGKRRADTHRPADSPWVLWRLERQWLWSCPMVPREPSDDQPTEVMAKGRPARPNLAAVS